ncbi:4'-phosphopantetheinyl transferase superfamily protein [Pseudoclavibacter sp. AY1H1]|uniref:4'-phosphopantetheinyl transferase family protein n=1 Tax=Pseudoclavibacter sp. AY1H1 TaxID=2080584 RepID=UPI0015E3FAE0|nr:4'-phosphopantetheinyl transferase superfamily protein [Pseudoclavibacter sp. AY1H1]
MIAVSWLDRAEIRRAAAPTGGWQLRRAAGRALLTETLAEFGVHDARVTRRSPEKPRLETSGLHFSTSHSGELSVCAVAREPIGIDLEAVGSPREHRLHRELPSLRSGFFTPAERREIATSPARLLEIFVLKESWGKRAGRGLGIGFGAFDEAALRASHPDVEFTRLTIPGAVCILAHPVGSEITVLRRTPTAIQLAAAAATDRKERAA